MQLGLGHPDGYVATCAVGNGSGGRIRESGLGSRYPPGFLCTRRDQSYVNPNMAFPFQDNFLVGTIHGANARPANSTNHQAENAKGNNEEVIEISDDKNDDNVSVLTTKIQDKLVALLVQTRKQLSGATVGSQVASGSNPPPEAA
jgi:hypothetical protein